MSRFASLFKPFARWVLRHELADIRRALEDAQFDSGWYREKYREAASRAAAWPNWTTSEGRND